MVEYCSIISFIADFHFIGDLGTESASRDDEIVTTSSIDGKTPISVLDLVEGLGKNLCGNEKESKVKYVS